MVSFPRPSRRRRVLSPVAVTFGWLPLLLVLGVILSPAWLLPVAVVVAWLFCGGVLLTAGLLACRLLGFAPLILSFGPLTIRYVTARPIFAWNHQWRLYFGRLLIVPLEGRGHLPRRLVLYSVAGPLLLLPSSIVLLLLNWPALAGQLTLASIPSLALAYAGLAGVVGISTTLLPFPNSLSRRLVRLSQGGPASRRTCALFLLAAANRAGLRPRAWSHDLLTQGMCLPDGSAEDIVAIDYAYHWALDRDDLLLASRYHDQRLALLATHTKLNAVARAIFTAEAAFFEACYRDNPRAAHALLTTAGAAEVPAHARSRAEAAILLAEGRHAEGLAAIRAGLAALPVCGDLGIRVFYEGGFAQLQAALGHQAETPRLGWEAVPALPDVPFPG